MSIAAFCIVVVSTNFLFADVTPDETAIRALFQARANAWEKRDIEGLMKDYAEDADLVSSKGEAASGKKEIGLRYRKIFDSVGYKNVVSKQFVNRVRVIRPDLAIVDAGWNSSGFRDDAGKPLPDKAGTSICVLVKADGNWKIVSLRSSPAPASN